MKNLVIDLKNNTTTLITAGVTGTLAAIIALVMAIK